KRGASFFADLQTATGASPADLLKALWDLVWSGEVTNDTLAPLRSYMRGEPRDDRRDRRFGVPFRSRRVAPPGSEGRWSLLPEPRGTATERAAALAQTLLARHGIVTREAAQAEEIAGGFSAVYPVLKAMEDAGRGPAAPALAQALAAQVDSGRRKAFLIARVDGEDVASSPLAPFLKEAGFTAGLKGYLKRAPLPRAVAEPAPPEEFEEDD